jgi:hypothetical protein
MAGVDAVAAVLVPHDHRDRVWLDNQITGQPACLIGRGFRGCLIRVSDGDQISHGVLLSHASLLFPDAGGAGEYRYPRVATRIALMVWRRFSAWSKTMLASFVILP